MLITPHIAVGSAIGSVLDSTLLVVILSIISHYVLDMMPHYDSGVRHGNPEGGIVFDFWDWMLIGFDIVIGLCLIYVFYKYTGKINVVWGGMATFMVDFLDKIFFVSFKNGKLGLDPKRKVPLMSNLVKFHQKIHFKLNPKYWYWGVVIQLAVFVFGIIIILR
jgi:hypothetical protein